MGLIDYISRHPVGKPQPPAYWDEQIVVAFIDDFVTCLEFQDSSNSNISLNENPIGYLGTRKLNRNENAEISISVHTQTAFTVKSQLFQTTRDNNSKFNIPHSTVQNKITHGNYPKSMSRQLHQGMALPTFKKITRKCHSGTQTQLTFAPIDYATFNDYLNKPPPPELTVSDVNHQVIPSQESYTFRRKKNEKVNAICQTVQEETTTTECQTKTVEEEDTPLFRKNLRKVMDIEFLAAATRRDRNLSPLMSMIKQKNGTR